MLNISQFQTIIPTRLLNSLSIMFHGQNANVESIKFPISTFETTLFHSIQRGCNITKAINGIKTNIIKYNMTRSLILQCKDSFFALELINKLKFDKNEIQNIISQSSKFTEFIGFTERIIGNLLYLRLEFTTGDASGHNMSTKASDIIIDYILFKYNNDDLKYISISGNYCTDKKNSSVNAILGRGYSVIAEGIINRDLCLKLLKTKSFINKRLPLSSVALPPLRTVGSVKSRFIYLPLAAIVNFQNY